MLFALLLIMTPISCMAIRPSYERCVRSYTGSYLNIDCFNIGLRGIPQDAPKDADKCQKLDLALNGVKTLPEGIFKAFTDLRELRLYANELNTISSVGFENLHSLQLLDLRMNGMTLMKERALSGLTLLKNLDLGENYLTSITEEDLANKGHLETLNLNLNQIRHIATGTFDGLANLRTLVLGYNGLTRISYHLFAKLKSLRRLYLHGNKLRSLSSATWYGLFKLNHLVLSENGLTRIDRDTLNFLITLKRVNLAWNNLTTVDKHMFERLRSLVHIDLKGNSLTSIDEDAFRHLTHLELLDLRAQRSRGKLVLTREMFEPFINEYKMDPKGYAFRVLLAGNSLKCTCKISWLVYLLYFGNLPDNEHFPRRSFLGYLPPIKCESTSLRNVDFAYPFLKKCGLWPQERY